MFPELIETDRLRLERHDRAVTPRQFYAAGGAGQSETVAEETEYVSWEPHPHPKESHDVREQFREQWEEREGLVYAVVPKATEPGGERYAGSAGLGLDWDTQTATLGIWLRKPYWGRGYSGERAAALASLAFDRLDLELVATEVLPANEQSLRAVEKYVDRLGGHREGRFRNRIVPEGGDGPSDVYRFSVSRTEYEAAVGDESLATFHDELAEPTLAGVAPDDATWVPDEDGEDGETTRN
ncbi:GNAT family N-acetyltransferase [Halobaculum sp. MBLA0147]|uniref:GNAT family N-acetyltransferase n=1 Tax=Halobaculum sp. MBLA0147 TaxID=3079934 RepID=UPI003524111A